MFSIEDLLSNNEQLKTVQDNINIIPDEAELPEVPNEINVALNRQQDYETPKKPKVAAKISNKSNQEEKFFTNFDESRFDVIYK